MQNKILPALAVIVMITYLLSQTTPLALEKKVLSPEEALKIKYASDAKVSPDGRFIAYLIHVPREPQD